MLVIHTCYHELIARLKIKEYIKMSDVTELTITLRCARGCVVRRYRGPQLSNVRSLDQVRNEICRRTNLAINIKVSQDWFSHSKVDLVEESARDSHLFNYVAEPRFDDHEWYRAYWIGYRSYHTGLVICIPWLLPQPTRPTLILIIEEPPTEWIESIVGFYVHHVRALIEEAQKPKESPSLN